MDSKVKTGLLVVASALAGIVIARYVLPTLGVAGWGNGPPSVTKQTAFQLAKPTTILAMPLQAPSSPATTALLQSLGWPGESAPNGYGDTQPLSNPTGPEDPVNLVATVYPSPWLANWRKARKFNARPQLVAVIDVKDPASLKENPLNLKAPTNCVYLYHLKGDAEDAGWSAAITQLQDPQHPEIGCVVPPAPTPQAPNLQTPVGAYQSVLYPVAPAARFVDAVQETGTITYDHETVLGIKCGLAWCEIGHRNISLPIHDGTVGGTQGINKAWHDEQQLWMRNSAGQLQLSGIRSSITPADNLDDHDASDYETTNPMQYVAVATIFFPNDISQQQLDDAGYGKTNPYHKTNPWGLKPGVNHLGLRHLPEGSGQCVVVVGSETCWRAAIVNASGKQLQKLRVSGLQIHPGAPQPGTARWYWTPLDEVVWIPCSEGCCTIETDS
ncbi:MAG: hypothetical protein ACREPM_19630 [Gemmatimonadaceae bacterium]